MYLCMSIQTETASLALLKWETMSPNL
jgi:hypothetical protein